MIEKGNRNSYQLFHVNQLDSTLWLFSSQIQSLEKDPLWRYLRKHPLLRRALTRLIANIRALLKGRLGKERRSYRRAKLHAGIIAASPLFDARWYCQQYFDVTYSSYTPEMHYALYGKDGRFPGPLFDARLYQQTYRDVALSDFTPLVHYELHGKTEERYYTPVDIIDIPALKIQQSGPFTTDPHALYNRWQENVEKVHHRSLPSLVKTSGERQQPGAYGHRPKFSVIVPTYNTPVPFLKDCIGSVLQQTWADWQLCIADDASTDAATIAVLESYATQDPRIEVVFRKENGHISQSSNTALQIARGEYVVLLDHDDMLAPTALQEIALLLPAQPHAAIIYSDEDKIDEHGVRCHPFFKPDFSPDLLYSQNYVCHLAVYKKELIDKIGGFRKGYEGSQDYDLLLRAMAHLDSYEQIIHIPRILYHWRMSPNSTASNHDNKDYATLAAVKALQQHFNTMQLPATVSIVKDGAYRIKWPIPATPPLVSLIIATRDCYQDLKKCIDSILNKTTYRSFEIIVIDNQSSDQETLDYLKEISRSPSISVYPYDHIFNYSAINNFGVQHAKGSIIGLINNDIEVVEPEWLSEMVSHAIRPDIGCVGAKLLYPDGTIQHAGVVLGIGGVASHSHKYLDGDHEGYFSRMRIVHNVSAVTAAALLVRKDIFEAVGGLDEALLPVAFNDIDFCLKVRTAGYRNLFTPFAVLTHFESKSRGAEDTPAKRARFLNECKLMKARWQHLLDNDPYYNPNLTKVREDYSIIEA